MRPCFCDSHQARDLPLLLLRRRRCSRYHITGEKKGTVEKFIDDLPGFPDNVRYDGEGQYWIAFFAVRNVTAASHRLVAKLFCIFHHGVTPN
jgi:hypothetical protein